MFCINEVDNVAYAAWRLQIYRGAVNVSSTLFHLTAYEIPSSEETSPVPALKFIAYEPRTQIQVGIDHPCSMVAGMYAKLVICFLSEDA